MLSLQILVLKEFYSIYYLSSENSVELVSRGQKEESKLRNDLKLASSAYIIQEDDKFKAQRLDFQQVQQNLA